jgi:DNA ligase (NAD+)
LNRIAELEKLIKYHQDKYYNEDPEISDSEFDELWDELLDLDPSNNIFKIVGKDASDGFEKAEHIIPMGSQNKAKNEVEFSNWWNKNIPSAFNILEHKLDGCSIELQYKSGKFNKAVTRGNGIVGDDITNNVKKMKGLEMNLKDTSFSGGVRGEVLMLRSVLKSKYSDKANCRNAANGVMKRKDGTGSEDLNIIVYDVTSINGKIDGVDNEFFKLDWLRIQGFNVVENLPVKTLSNVIDYRNSINRDKLDYKWMD